MPAIAEDIDYDLAEDLDTKIESESDLMDDLEGYLIRDKLNLENEKPEISDLLLFPNPTTGELIISFNNSQEQLAYIYVITMSGQLVMTRNMMAVEGENNLVISLDEFSKGAFIVILKTASKHISKTIILE